MKLLSGIVLAVLCTPALQGGDNLRAQSAAGTATGASGTMERRRPQEAAQPEMRRGLDITAQPLRSIRVEIRYPIEFGYQTEGAGPLPGSGPSSCDAFSVGFNVAGPLDPNKPIPLTRYPTMREANRFFICDVLISELPLQQAVTVRATLSEPGVATQPWRGGSKPQPPAGWQRAMTDGPQVVTLTESAPRATLVYNLAYQPMTGLVQPRRRIPRGR